MVFGMYVIKIMMSAVKASNRKTLGGVVGICLDQLSSFRAFCFVGTCGGSGSVSVVENSRKRKGRKETARRAWRVWTAWRSWSAGSS